MEVSCKIAVSLHLFFVRNGGYVWFMFSSSSQHGSCSIGAVVAVFSFMGEYLTNLESP